LKSINTSQFNALKKFNPSSPSHGTGSDDGLSSTTMSIANRWFMKSIDGTVTLLLESGADVDWLD